MNLSWHCVSVLQEWSRFDDVTEKLCKRFDELESDISRVDSGSEGDLLLQLHTYEVSFIFVKILN